MRLLSANYNPAVPYCKCRKSLQIKKKNHSHNYPKEQNCSPPYLGYVLTKRKRSSLYQKYHLPWQ